MKIKEKKLITKDGLKKLKEELKKRQTEIAAEIAERLDKAKAQGDLSENSAYISALEDFQLNQSKIKELKNLIANVEIAPDKQGDSVIDVGDEIEIQDENGDCFTYKIVGLNEGNPSKNLVSVDSILGKSLVGKREGETVSVQLPMKVKKYKILAIK